MKRLGLALAFLFTVTILFAQFPFTRSMEVRSGQLRPAISCMAQDAQGLMWVGSDLGVFRTDGDHTELMLRSEQDPVTAITALKEGIAASFTSGVIMRCGALGCDTLLIDTLIRRFPIRAMHMDPIGRLWLVSGGAGVWMLHEGAVDRITQGHGLPDDHVNALAILPDGRTVVATDQGLAVCSTSGVDEVFGQAEGAPDNLVLSVTVGAGGVVLAGTDQRGVFSWLPGERTSTLLDPTWSRGPVNAVAVQGERVWVATHTHGVMLYETAAGKGRYEQGASVTGAIERARDLLVDQEGAVWWCSGNDRLVRADATILVVPEHEGLDLRNTTALCNDREDRIWFATAEGLFHHASAFVEDARVERVPLKVDPRTPIVSLASTMDGTVWAATFGSGVHAIRPNGSSQHFTTREGLLNNNVLSVRARGNTVWFATLEGVCTFQDGAFSTTPKAGPGFVFDVLPLPSGAALCATDGSGVVRVDGRSTVQLGSGGARTFYALSTDHTGQAWVAGPGTGLCSVGSVDVHCTGADRSPFDGDLYAVGRSGDRMVVFGSTGVAAFAPGPATWSDVTARFGLEDIEAELNVVCNDRSGALWFACDKGLIRIESSAVHYQERIPTVITALSVGNEPHRLDKYFRTAHDRNDLTFRFTGVHYSDPTSMGFEYRLLGYDARSRVTRERQVAYALLPAGEYRFQVRAFSGKVPSDELGWVEVAFKVELPWYRLPWVIALAVLLVLVGLLGLVRIRDHRLRVRQRLEQDKVRFQLEALRSQVDPHFLFNSFNTLVELIETDPDHAVGHVDRLSTFFRSILQLRDKELIPLREELALLDTYFALEKERFGAAIHLEVHVPASALDQLVVPLTLQLLVENGLKHNAATAQYPLVVEVGVEGSILVVSNTLAPRLSPPRSTGFGLESIRKRYAALASQSMEVHQDGTRFVVRVPLIGPGK